MSRLESRLTQARPGENDRAWSAAAGAASLTTGLAQVAWILDRIRRQSKNTKPFLDWRSFQRSQSGLFIWEAFVTGTAKAGSHEADAMGVSPRPGRPRAKERRENEVPNSFVDWRRPPLDGLVRGHPVAP